MLDFTGLVLVFGMVLKAVFLGLRLENDAGSSQDQKHFILDVWNGPEDVEPTMVVDYAWLPCYLRV